MCIVVNCVLISVVITVVHPSVPPNKSSSSASSEEGVISAFPSSSEEKTAKPLPGVDANWRNIWRKKLQYVDKTPYLLKLLKRPGELNFIVRPRRFGKSTFARMMVDFFEGNEAAFEGLEIQKYGNAQFFKDWLPKKRGPLKKWIKFPCIHLNFIKMGKFKTIDDFEKLFCSILTAEWRRNGVDQNVNCFTNITSSQLNQKQPPLEFSTFFLAIQEKFDPLPIMIIIDEYDFAFQHAFMELKDNEIAKAVRDEINDMLSVIKGMLDDYIGFVFVTGVTKLPLPVLQSTGADAFADLTYDKEFSGAFGFEGNEIKTSLGVYVRMWVRQRSKNAKAKKPIELRKLEEEIKNDLKLWYNGYQFDKNNKACKVYNPISTIKALRDQRCRSYWASSISMDYLVKKFYEKPSPDKWDELLKGVLIPQSKLCKKLDPLIFEPPLITWMFMYGYLTISNYDETSDEILLKFPNEEIKSEVEEKLSTYIPDKNGYIEDFPRELDDFKIAMESENIAYAMQILSTFVFPTYKHPLTLETTRGEACRRLGLFLRAARLNIKEAIQFKKYIDTNDPGGDIDILINTLTTSYVVEIKCSTNKNEAITISAINQLVSYHRKYKDEFITAAGNPHSFQLLAINILHSSGSLLLNGWISIPCVNGNLQFENVKASSGNLEARIIGKHKNDVEEILENVSSGSTATTSPAVQNSSSPFSSMHMVTTRGEGNQS